MYNNDDVYVEYDIVRTNNCEILKYGGVGVEVTLMLRPVSYVLEKLDCVMYLKKLQCILSIV